MAQLIYRGNPGYLFPFAPGPLSPGDVVDVPDEAVASVGADFEPAKPKPAPKPKPDPAPEAIDPEGDQP